MGSTVTLSAQGMTDLSTFTNPVFGWGNECAGAGSAATCSVTMSGNRTVCVAFTHRQAGSVAGEIGPVGCVPPPPTALLKVAPAPGSADGYVSGPGISCGFGLFVTVTNDCTEVYLLGTAVTLSAQGVTDLSTFTNPVFGWGQDCAAAGAASSCTVTMSANRVACVAFRHARPGAPAGEIGPVGCVPPPPTATLTVSPPPGSADGHISGPGISCGFGLFVFITNDCTETYLLGSAVTLFAQGVSDLSTFTNPVFGWGKDCVGAAAAATCSLSMSVNRTVCVAFTHTRPGAPAGEIGPSGCVPPPPTATLTVSPPPGSADGYISGPGISCGFGFFVTVTNDCSERYLLGSAVTLSAQGVSDLFTFTNPVFGWGKDCVGAAAAATCSLTMSANRTVCAAFTHRQPGAVAGEIGPAGCVPPPPTATLTISPPPGSADGYISGPGISCGFGFFVITTNDCTETYLVGTAVTLSAQGLTDLSTFTNPVFGWGKDCVGAAAAASCSLTMSANRVACVAFTHARPGAPAGEIGPVSCVPPPPTVTLTVSPPPGSADGYVSGPGISCGFGLFVITTNDCTETYLLGQQVTLSAQGQTDLSTFQNQVFRWGKDCLGAAGAATCSLTMSRNRTVCVAFTHTRPGAPAGEIGPAGCVPPPATVTLTISPPPGSADGYVSGPGISCGFSLFVTVNDDCTEPYLVGQKVILSAYGQTDGFTYQNPIFGWGQDCAAAGAASTCRLLMSTNRVACVAFTHARPGAPPGEIGPTGCLPPAPGSTDAIRMEPATSPSP